VLAEHAVDALTATGRADQFPLAASRQDHLVQRQVDAKTTFADAFAMADRVLYAGVGCITDRGGAATAVGRTPA
jgi:hypothetical protein